MKNKKVLVTGADGFIGSHLTEKLVQDGYKVKAFVQYNSFGSNGWLDTIDRKTFNEIEIFSGDIRDPYGVRTAMKDCDIVFHLAALIAIPYSYHSPNSYVDTNIIGTLNVLQAAKDFNINKIIHTSTSEVYGTAKYVPINEEHPLQGQSPYSATKIAADQLAFSFYTSFNLPVITIRPFNTYGPRQSTRAVIPTIITQILSGKKSINLGSLTTTRDFNYVDDTVNGFISAISAEDCYGEVFNLGSNFEVSIKETSELISCIIGEEILLNADTIRLRPLNSEVERLWADNNKALTRLNWKPNFAGIDGFKKGLIETINWYKVPDNLKLFNSNIYNV